MSRYPTRGMTYEQAFWFYVDKSGDCWEWTGARKVTGYARFRGRNHAHRVAWELTNGPIPDGLWVLHHCDNPPCVNPDHLWLGTNSDNIRDSSAKGRRNNYNRAKTHCKRGHAFVGYNIIPRSEGRRECRECWRAAGRARRARYAIAKREGIAA